MKRIGPKLKRLLPAIQKNILLKNYTTLKIGGPAKYFYVAKTKNELIKAILTAKKFKLPFFILGGGSNLLVSDKGFNGMVIKCQISNVKCQTSRLYAEAGAPLFLLVNQSTKQSLSGLEWAAGIPGTVGGAIRGNAGAFDGSMADVIKKVEVLDKKDLKIRKLNQKDCKFSYRDSVFKKNKDLVILSAESRLKKGNKREIQKKMKEYLSYRKKTQPLNFSSAGSIFQNQKFHPHTKIWCGKQIKNQKLLKEFPRLKEFNTKGLVPAAYLIEKCGLKGKRMGGVKISEKHANFIINLGKGQAKDVIRLINLVKKKVKKKFGVELEEEIQRLGF